MSKWIELTSKNVGSLIGKTIKWKAPAYSANEPYGGEVQISEVLFDGKINPIIPFEGDNITFAFLDDEGNYCYSDENRFITFQILD